MLTIVHVAIDPDAIDLLDVVGEELGDVFISRPVHGNAEIVAVLRLEFFLQIRGQTNPSGTNRRFANC